MFYFVNRNFSTPAFLLSPDPRPEHGKLFHKYAMMGTRGWVENRVPQVLYLNLQRAANTIYLWSTFLQEGHYTTDGMPLMESPSGGFPKVLLSKLWNSSYKYAMLEQEDGWKNMIQPLICLNLRGQSWPWMLARPIYGPGDSRSYNFNFNDVFFSRCLRTGDTGEARL